MTTFDDMNLKENVLRGIYTYGFEHPSEIQTNGIPLLKSGSDVIAQACSGQGKSATFIIGALERVDETNPDCQAVIISPTRELALQSHTVLGHLGEYTGITSSLCIGGTTVEQVTAQIIVATPGRLLGMLQRKKLFLDTVKLLVIDEADELLTDGFIDQIRSIIEYLPVSTQMALFSATYPKGIKEYTDKFMNDPEEIFIRRENLTLSGIQQFYVDVDRDEYKFSTLCDLYQSLTISQAIIYVNSKNRIIHLHKQLNEQGYPVGLIHGSMSPTERMDIMKEFRNGDLRILLSTDLLARGIDVQQVSLVINYDLPMRTETYIHRIGRSGRYGRKGIAINFTTRRDAQTLGDLERYYHTQVNELPANLTGLFSG
jgi:superfamily II DNA/RNA helicase